MSIPVQLPYITFPDLVNRRDLLDFLQGGALPKEANMLAPIPPPIPSAHLRQEQQQQQQQDEHGQLHQQQEQYQQQQYEPDRKKPRLEQQQQQQQMQDRKGYKQFKSIISKLIDCSMQAPD
jgi:hypothetical protein